MKALELPTGWSSALKNETGKEYFCNLKDFVQSEYNTKTIFPSQENIFSCFKHCSFENVKVVIIGQDPYHGEGQANGLSFSVSDGIKQPPSLKNIFKERESDLGLPIPESGNLEVWAKQGVLLLNSILTVEKSKPGSHQKKGWETFTDSVVSVLSEQKENLVFILWGAYAHKKGASIDEQKHFIIKSAHPSPFSARNGFFGTKPFSQCNTYLEGKGLDKIEW